jgi:hypothetical protein
VKLFLSNHGLKVKLQSLYYGHVLFILCALSLALIIIGVPTSNFTYKLDGTVFAASTSNVSSNPPGLLTYKNDSYGVNIQYPANWSLNPGEGNDNSGDSSTDIVTFSPKDTSSSVTFDVSVDKVVDSSENLKQYVSDSISDNKIELKNYTASEPILNGVILASSPAYKVIYSFTDQGENIKGLETGTMVGNKVYFITYENSPSKFVSDLPTVQKMIDSFKLASSKSSG